MATTADAALEARILEFVRDGGSGEFGELALALFARQFGSLPAYRERCESLGVTPDTIEGWTKIPAIGAQAHGSTPSKPSESSRAPLPAEQDDAAPLRVESPLKQTVLRRAAPELFDPRRLHLLVGSAANAASDSDSGVGADPDSGFVAALLEALGRQAPENSFVATGRLDVRTLRSWLGARQRDRRPVAAVADAPGFARLVGVLERRAVKFRLPPGSEAFCVASFESAAAEEAGAWKRPLLELLGLGPETCRRVLTGPRGSTPLVEPPAMLGDRAPLPHWVRLTGAPGGGLLILDLASLDAPVRRLEPAAAAPWLQFSS